MMKQRKGHTAGEKVAVSKRRRLDQVPVSAVSDELGLQPTLFCRWQKELFENAAAAFPSKARAPHQAQQERIAYLGQHGVMPAGRHPEA